MIGNQPAVQRCDHHALVAVRPVDRDLFDGRVAGLRRALDELQHRQLLVDADIAPRHRGMVEVAGRERVKGLRRSHASAGCDRRRGARCCQHRRQRQVLGKGVAGLVTDHDAQPDALLDARTGLAHDAVFERQRVAARVLEIQVGRVGSVGRQLRHDPGRDRLVDAEPGHEGIGWRRLADRGRRLHATACEEARHRQHRAASRHMAQKIPAPDCH